MTTPISGGCLCGEIRYESDGEVVMPFLCHCQKCQKAGGSAFTAGFLVAKDSLQIIQGTPKGYSVTGDSGKSVTREFCSNCGSGLFSHLEIAPSMVVVKVGTLDDPSWFKPAKHLWTESEMPWAHIEDDADRLPQGS